MTRIAAFGRFWLDFVVGDDWRAALGVGAAIAATAGLAHIGGLDPWWLLPAAVLLVLYASLRRAARA